MDRLEIYVGAGLVIAQLVMAWLAVRVRTKKQKGIALGTDVVSVIGNALIAASYNNLPGKGEAPGITYLGETVMAMGLTIVSFVVCLITIVVLKKESDGGKRS